MACANIMHISDKNQTYLMHTSDIESVDLWIILILTTMHNPVIGSYGWSAGNDVLQAMLGDALLT